MIDRRAPLSHLSVSHGRVTLETLIARMLEALPSGSQLPREEWQRRHRLIVALLAVHAVGIAIYGVVQGVGLLHALAEAGLIVAFAIGAGFAPVSRAAQATIASIGLLIASSLLVHLSSGLIEMHFHFFVMIALVTLYQSWTPFLVVIGYVILHHGVLGVLLPTAVYNHADAWEHPWKWASIHGLFVLGASVAGLMNWRLEEAARGAVARAEADATRQQSAREQAEASIRARDQFLSIASHELLTPITSLKLYLHLLKRPGRAVDGSGPVDTFGGYEIVERQTEKLHQLVSQLLDVTRIESGHLRLNCDTTDLASVVADVVTSARTRDDRRTIHVHSPSQLFVQADALRLEQVLTNLIDNALKYSPSDAPVDVALEDGPAGTVRIVVADRGPGVPASLRDAIFDRFYRAEETKAAQGVGLGLFVSRQIVLLHGGQIEAEERPGGGARFVVTLPTGLDLQSDASPPTNSGDGLALMT